ncbi:hypothetical protein GOOTI_026_00020 [Gordonia otitidis NBRC 100426]|uniref:Uncharacterized protein n=1 Tax=Gordonia otitidis (strain DSM 44809 / CCUG 52243 / JCM 12355 / NBRC 100426 / IFM 10032) TaxID=1108044 RepID=H5TH28_GORO1|nr:hypothetical protein GOOTI_026_00020 [Gordonia otitidis NBRC 100426]
MVVRETVVPRDDGFPCTAPAPYVNMVSVVDLVNAQLSIAWMDDSTPRTVDSHSTGHNCFPTTRGGCGSRHTLSVVYRTDQRACYLGGVRVASSAGSGCGAESVVPVR